MILLLEKKLSIAWGLVMMSFGVVSDLITVVSGKGWGTGSTRKCGYWLPGSSTMLYQRILKVIIIIVAFALFSPITFFFSLKLMSHILKIMRNKSNILNYGNRYY